MKKAILVFIIFSIAFGCKEKGQWTDEKFNKLVDDCIANESNPADWDSIEVKNYCNCLWGKFRANFEWNKIDSRPADDSLKKWVLDCGNFGDYEESLRKRLSTEK